LEAVAQAKLEAIERSITQEEDDSYSRKSSRKAIVEPLERTKAWVVSQPPFEGEVVRNIKREVNDEFYQTLPHPIGRRSERHHIYETQEPSRVVQQCMRAIATINGKLTASLAKLSLPKCHPDLFSGDATMFHPWKSAFKGQWQRKFLLAVSILLDNQTMKILSFLLEHFSLRVKCMQTFCFAAILEKIFEKLSRRSMNFVTSLAG
jgi:hypothetical protein